MKRYTIYAHVSPSDKCYIGITCLKPNFRWGKDGHGYKSQYFSRAIQKYGWDNFQHIIMAQNLTKKDACALEKILISLLQTNNPQYGYNITSGGEATTGFHHTEETKERIAELVSHPVDQYDLSGKYIKSWRSAQVAARELNMDGSAILKCCNGKYQSSKGYVWRYKGDSFDKHLRKKYQQPTLRKKVNQYSKDGELIKTWDSLSDIKEHFNLGSCSAISSCCKRKRQSAYNYIWRYEGDELL